MPWNPTTVAYGVRHARLFGFLGRAGDAIDAVLALQGRGNVPRKCFSKIGWPNQVTAALQNSDGNFRLTFNVDGIVLTVDLADIQMTQQNVRDMFTEVVSAALPITNPGRLVNRIGIVETYNFSLGAPGEVAARTLTRLANLGRPVDFSFRAAFRRPVEPAEGDWWNTILQVAAVKAEEDADLPNALSISIDHQQYFASDRAFTAGMVREHYGSFYREAESIQTHQLAGLGARESALVHA